MPSSILKDIVPFSLYADFLIEHCDLDYKNDLVIDRNCFKRSLLNNTLFPFLSSLQPYYHESTQHYVTRRMTYTRFLTVLRQLFRQSCMHYESLVTHTSSRKEVRLVIQKQELITENS
jgi:hypothetical protein